MNALVYINALALMGGYFYLLDTKQKQVDFRDSRLLHALLIDPDSHIYQAVLHTEYLSDAEWRSILGITAKQFFQIKEGAAGAKSAHIDSILEIAKLLEHGLNTFGDKEIFIQYLRSKPAILDGKTPVDLLESAQGRALINEELTRIEHGLFA
jgi:uncharacterized protein (DUF2384 family)